MPKTKSKGESKSAVFKRIFLTNKQLLNTPSIADVLKQFEAAVGRAVTNNDKNIAANIKSKLRKELGLRGHRGKKGQRGSMLTNGHAARTLAPRAASALVALEGAVDDCIYMARKMECDELAGAVDMLRRVRDQLIVMAAGK